MNDKYKGCWFMKSDWTFIEKKLFNFTECLILGALSQHGKLYFVYSEEASGELFVEVILKVDNADVFHHSSHR